MTRKQNKITTHNFVATGILFMLFLCVNSCEKENYRNNEQKTNEKFFAYNGQVKLTQSIVNFLRIKNDSVPFAEKFTEKYGYPVWQQAVDVYKGEQYTLFVPVYKKGQAEIENIWVFRIKAGNIGYSVMQRRSVNAENNWTFDYMTQEALKKTPKSGIRFEIEKLPNTRGTWVENQRCSQGFAGFEIDGILTEVSTGWRCWTDVVYEMDRPNTHDDPGSGGCRECMEEIGPGLDEGGGGYTPAPEIIEDISFKNTKAECIYNELKNLSGGFNAILKKFDNTFSVAHLKLIVNNNLGDNTFGITYPPQNYIIRIELNDNRFGEISDLGKATTMIHEMIHAEIYRKLLSAAQKGDLNHNEYTPDEMIAYVNSLRNNFSGLYDYYWKRYHPEWGHDMMASHYRNTIINVLKEIDNNRLDESIYNALSWAGLGEFEAGTTTYAWSKLSETERRDINDKISNYFFKGFSKCN